MSAVIDVPVTTASRCYLVRISAGLLNALGARLRAFSAASRFVVVTSESVASILLPRVMASLAEIGPAVLPIVLADGEAHKTLATADAVYAKLLENGCDRSSVVVGLGGGVVCDIAGFIAATYMRGVPLVLIPTTLLAQLDAAIGGKVAVNHAAGKNTIGLFYQPWAVLIDSSVLHTLPTRDYRSGLAELIKYGMLDSKQRLAWIEQQLPLLVARDQHALSEAIVYGCRQKAVVVAADEGESGSRAFLNLGHTFAHAIERGSGYRGWNHGEAVAVGLLLAADLSWRCGYLEGAAVEWVRRLLLAAGLPVEAPGWNLETYLDLWQSDKKRRGAQRRFVLLRELGAPFVADAVPLEKLEQTLSAYRSSASYS